MQVDVNGILEKYFAAARAARTGTFYAQAKQRKAYLTKDVIERWGIGRAPSLKQALAAGSTEEELLSVGLLRQRERGGQYMHFRDCMVFPYRDDLRYIYASSRRLVDHDPKTHEALPKDGKAFYMPLPNPEGVGGLPMPAGFDLNCLDRAEDVLLVEGVPDAIACNERGHPAVAILSSSPRTELAHALAGFQGSVYLALDGTADVDLWKQCAAAGRIGPDCLVCTLPKGKDPDDIPGDEWPALKEAALDALNAWLALIEAFKPDSPEWFKATGAFKTQMQDWLKRFPLRADGLTERAREALSLTHAEAAEAWGLQATPKAAAAPLPPPGPDRAEKPAEFPPEGEDAVRAKAGGAGRRRRKPRVVKVAEGEAKKYLDDELPAKIDKASVLHGTERDLALIDIFSGIAHCEIGVSTIVRERVKKKVCGNLGLTSKAYDTALREARAAQDVGGGDVDWPSLARQYIEQLAPKAAIVRYDQEWYVWTDRRGGYRSEKEEDVRARFAAWMDSEAIPVTTTSVSNFCEAVRMLTLVSAWTEVPCWLRGAGDDKRARRRQDGIYAAFRNGILDMEHPERGLIDPTPDYFTTNTREYLYDASAQCPKWEEAIALWQPTELGRRLLQDWAGYCFERGHPRQAFMVCAGDGQNGKSQYTDILQELIGKENCSAVGLEALDGKRQFALLPLLHKQLNVVGDANDVERVGEGNLKSISGGDRITIDRKHISPVTLVLPAKFVLNCNNMPYWRDRSEGLWRRFLPSNWTVKIPPEKRIEDFAKVVAREEIAGIFNWALEGFRRVRREGFRRDEQALYAVKYESHPELQFFDEEIELDEGLTCRCYVDRLVEAYNNWLKRSNHQGRMKRETLCKALIRWIVPRLSPDALRKMDELPGREKQGGPLTFRDTDKDTLGVRKRYYRGIKLLSPVVPDSDKQRQQELGMGA